jgi:hypothetical protein
MEVKYAAALSVLREGGSASVAAQPVLQYLNANNLAVNDESCAAMAHPVSLRTTTSKNGLTSSIYNCNCNFSIRMHYGFHLFGRLQKQSMMKQS